MALQFKLEASQTDSSLTLNLYLILTKWMDTGTVVAADFSKQFYCAIYSQ